MPYRKLYKDRQHEAAVCLPKSWYVDHAKGLSWVQGISLKATDALPSTHLLGFIVKHNAGFLDGLIDNYTIVVAEGLGDQMERS